MISIADLGSIAEFLGIFGVAISVFYLAIQIRQAKQASEREAAFEMLRSYETPDIMSIMHKVFSQPDNMSKQEVENHYKEDMGCLFSFRSSSHGRNWGRTYSK